MQHAESSAAAQLVSRDGWYCPDFGHIDMTPENMAMLPNYAEMRCCDVPSGAIAAYLTPTRLQTQFHLTCFIFNKVRDVAVSMTNGRVVIKQKVEEGDKLMVGALDALPCDATLRVEFKSREYASPGNVFRYVHYRPRITKLEIEKCEIKNFEPRCLNDALDSLLFEWSGLESDDAVDRLVDIVLCCRRLEALRFHVCGMFPSTTGGRFFRALYQRAPLQHLHIRDCRMESDVFASFIEAALTTIRAGTVVFSHQWQPLSSEHLEAITRFMPLLSPGTLLDLGNCDMLTSTQEAFAQMLPSWLSSGQILHLRLPQPYSMFSPQSVARIAETLCRADVGGWIDWTLAKPDMHAAVHDVLGRAALVFLGGRNKKDESPEDEHPYARPIRVCRIGPAVVVNSLAESCGSIDVLSLGSMVGNGDAHHRVVIHSLPWRQVEARIAQCAQTEFDVHGSDLAGHTLCVWSLRKVVALRLISCNIES